jgi:hypothetical protein
MVNRRREREVENDKEGFFRMQEGFVCSKTIFSGNQVKSLMRKR